MSLDNLPFPPQTSSAPRFAPITGDFEAAIYTLTSVLQFIEETRPDASLRVVILNNLIVSLTATIEETLRSLFMEYLSVLENEYVDYRALRDDLKISNLDCAIQELKSYKSCGVIQLTANVVSNLEKCLNGQPGYRLLKDKLVYNQGNFKSQQVTEISKNVGLSGLWRNVCDCTEIEDFTGEINVDRRVTRLVAKWNEVFAERDLVVHRISQANGWGSEIIQQSLDLGKIVVKRIAFCLSNDVDLLVSSNNREIRENIEN
ncbi:MAG: HEPN domain-containing protein [Trichloromonadaceae bacterium]